MVRLRTALFLLAITALLLSGAPVFAAAGDPGLPSWMTAPAASPGLDAGPCPDPGPSATLGTPAAVPMVFLPPHDFILCSCDFCRDYPDVTCRISPSGFSILCEDYSQIYCESEPVS